MQIVLQGLAELEGIEGEAEGKRWRGEINADVAKSLGAHGRLIRSVFDTRVAGKYRRSGT